MYGNTNKYYELKDKKNLSFFYVQFLMTFKSLVNMTSSKSLKRLVPSGDTTFKNKGRKEIDMEFLEKVLGAELYAQVAEKINAHNGNEANKDMQIKVGNLASGEYVGKGKYDALNELLKGKETELDTANGLIAELKKGTKGNEELQQKIGTYETQVAELQAQLQETKVNAALKVALLSEKAVDVDYLTFKLNEKLKEKGEALELDENENIKGWKDRIEDLKVQFPNMFEAGSKKIIEPNKLPEGDGERTTVTKEQFEKMGYKSRVELKANNPELYSQLSN